MNSLNRSNLCVYLMDKGLLDQDQVRILEIEHNKTGKTFESLVKELGFIPSSLLQENLQKRNDIKSIDLTQTNIDIQLAKILDKEYCMKNKLLVFEEIENEICIAIVEEIDLHVKDFLKKTFKKSLKLFLSDENSLLEYIEYIYSQNRGVENWVELLDKEYSAQESFATRLVYELIVHCIKEKVSDIHIEPEEFFVRIRVRKDGLLKPLCVFPKDKWPGLCVRIKMLANMDISQSFIPQDGRFDFFAFARKVDLRVSSRPVSHGENIVLRILDTHSKAPVLEELGYSEENMKELNKITKQTNGVFIVTGPTGSGKSTLLFAMLSKIANSSVSIATIEDPIEYTCPYMRQTDINAYKNMSFASALKSILRQDPDIISISEIRDSETAVMAMRAAMTGRMLFTTLHTNDIFGVFDRLIDLGVDRRVLIQQLSGIATQRLVRKVCTCGKECEPTQEEKKMLDPFEIKKFIKPMGCKACNYSGYLARFAVCQVLHIDDKVRDLLDQNQIHKAKEILYEKGLLSLKDELKLRVCNGETTLEEANRVVCLD